MSNYFKCDVCGREHETVKAGRWLFYCDDKPECKAKETRCIYENELEPALNDGSMPECDVLEPFI